MSLKTILVPTDFSKNATNALNYAIKVAEKSKSKIILLNAYHANLFTPDIPMDFLVEQGLAMKEIVDKQLEATCEKARKSSKIKMDWISYESLAVDSILDAIKKKKIDLIVMGTKGASGIKEVVIGSVTSKIIEKATCPVLAIPAKATYDGLKKITYATDYHASDIPILKKVIEFAKLFKAKINVLHIAISEYTPQVEKDTLKNFIVKVEKKIEYKMTYQILFSKDEEKALEKYLKNKSTDLLVLSTRDRTLLEKFLAKSITKTLAYHSNIPILAFHYKKTSYVFI